MKILLVHNFYQSSSPSGEDAVFRNEVDLLKKNGIDVLTFEKYNDDVRTFSAKIKTAIEIPWSRKTYKELKDLLKKEKPDIAHFHNIWYLISPSAYYACKDAGVPVVQTLHNFRFFCINGLLMRNGRICEECIGKIPWRGIRYGCYRGSRMYSLPIAIADGIHFLKGTWRKKVDAFIALTEFGKKKYIECGLPEAKNFVKPNFLPDLPVTPLAETPFAPPYAIFLGRLSAEKGLSVLINAISLLRLNVKKRILMKIVGDGPLRENLQQIVKYGNVEEIEFTGKKSFTEVTELLKYSRFMVLPALSYEGFPMAIREAFACGKPVIASRLGAMAELVEDRKTGLLFEPGNPEDLATKIHWLTENEHACEEMGRNARKVFEQRYTAENNFGMLMKIYEAVLNR